MSVVESWDTALARVGVLLRPPRFGLNLFTVLELFPLETPLSFQPFAVQCLTCACQLRVSDPAIVGTISACPKCGSMVEINRPEGQVEIGRSGVDSQAITEEAIAPDPGLAGGAAQQINAEGFAGSDSVLAENTDGLSGAMPPDWQSAKTEKSRQIALVIALSATGLIAAVMFFGWFVSSWGQREEEQASTVVNQPDEQNEQTPNDHERNAETGVVAGPDVEIDRDSTTESVGTQDQTASVTPSVPNPNESVTPDNETQNQTGTGLDPEAKPDESPVAMTPGVPESDGGTDALIPSDLLPPSVLDPPTDSGVAASTGKPTTGKPTTGNPATAETTDEADTTPGMQDLPPELAQYTQFLLDDGAQAKPTLQAPPTMEEVKLEAAAEEQDEDLRIPVVPKELDLRADLAIRLALASDGYPASDLMLLISQVTGVPIQMDWPSFDLAGADIQQTVPTTKTWRSARELLDDTAGVLNAEIQEQPTLLLMTLRDDVFDEAANHLISVEDFGVGVDSAQDFLQEFLAGDKGDANPREVSQLRCFATEALRRMRGVTPKMEEARFRRWAREVNDTGAEWTVLTGGEFGPPLDAPISVAGLLRRTAKMNQAISVFNWHDAVRRGAPPEHLLLPHKEDNAGSTLANTLSPLGLQVRQVDPGHWWVGTEATYDRLPIFVWTPPLGQARAAFVERMKKVIAGSSPVQYRLAIDETSDRALMLLPRFIVRQLPTIIPEVAVK